MEAALETGIAVCWLRRDLRLEDNTALYHALKSGRPVLLLFIFDPEILETLPDKSDRRVAFIHRQLQKINEKISQYGSSLLVLHELPKKAFLKLLSDYAVKDVFTNHDYEPYARRRDKEIADVLAENRVDFYTFKDQVIFEKNEVMKPDGSPYTVFTPYSRIWKNRLHSEGVPGFPSEEHLEHLLKMQKRDLPSLEEIGFRPISDGVPEADLSEALIRNYSETRNLPAISG
ncbi:MAG: deoxyribodipyrimidine photo-lyase, partial [Salinimicrobium sediminis]|nr:deoxyribodipyrimidine photo-lyase [Salinimicrobium sediminis]